MDTAIAIVSYNRPHYLKAVIAALERTPQSREVPFFLFQDGGAGATSRENSRIFNGSSINRLLNVVAMENLGCGRNTIEARRRLFDREGFDSIILIEDDLVVSPHYFTLVNNLLNWSMRFADVGIVQGWSLCKLCRSEKSKVLSNVKLTADNLWGYAITRSVWMEMREFLYEYERRFLVGRPYHLRSNKKIMQFFFDAWKEGKNHISGNCYPAESPCPLEHSTASGQDMATSMALWKAGYCRMATVVNRAKYVGRKGIHSTPQHFDSHFSHVSLDVFDEDSCIRDFIPTLD